MDGDSVELAGLGRRGHDHHVTAQEIVNRKELSAGNGIIMTLGSASGAWHSGGHRKPRFLGVMAV